MAAVKKKTHKDGGISYEIRVSLGRDINGKQILKYRTWVPSPGMTVRQIEKAIEREKVLFEEQCRSGVVLDTSTKFADFAERWLDANKNVFSPAYKQWANDLLPRINAAIGHIPIGKLKSHHLQDFYSNLAEVGVKKTNVTAHTHKLAGLLKERGISRDVLSKAAGVAPFTITVACQGKTVSIGTAEKISCGLDLEVTELFEISGTKEALSSKTILHHHRLISSILKTAMRWQAIHDNPAQRVVPPKVQRKEAAFLDDKQVLQVAEALSKASIKWRALLMLLMYSGMRRGEACGLTWLDVDLNDNLVHITKSNQYLRGKGIYEKDTKTESSNRVVKLPDDMINLLHEYKTWQTEERLKMGDRWVDTGKVFTQENGLPMHPDSITKWTRKFRDANELPYFTPHSLRHTSATLLIMSGVPVRAVAARLGHADQNTTNVIYSHSIQSVDALASDVVGDILKTAKNSDRRREVRASQKPHK